MKNCGLNYSARSVRARWWDRSLHRVWSLHRIGNICTRKLFEFRDVCFLFFSLILSHWTDFTVIYYATLRFPSHQASSYFSETSFLFFFFYKKLRTVLMVAREFSYTEAAWELIWLAWKFALGTGIHVTISRETHNSRFVAYLRYVNSQRNI